MAWEYIDIKVSDIKKGDQFWSYNHGVLIHHWTALADAELLPGLINLRVRFDADGGIDSRQWDEDIAIKIKRYS